MIYNGVIVTAVVSWAVAQLIKTFLHTIKFKTFYAQRLVGAGGMPSSHTSMVISVLIAVGRKDGTGSTVFALMFILGAIVIYDAMGVRRAAGLHAREINRIKESFTQTDEDGKPLIFKEKKLQEYLGHTPLEVVGGAIVGIVIGLVIPV
ncbi:MAG: divergent PAP2 family protein [Ruminococcus sp.]|nr:divergent PAP2 family protein [Ruminococcus sp.]